MTKYLEQTEWLLNPHPDKRKGNRSGMQCWNPGTRWYFDESTGIVSGEGMWVGGKLAQTIIAHSKEVEPGFGAIVTSVWEFRTIIGTLIEQGRLSVDNIRDILRLDEVQDEDSDGDDDADSEAFDRVCRRNDLDQHRFGYRHWLILDPPSDKLVQKVEEDEHRTAVLDEYAKRIEKPS